MPRLYVGILDVMKGEINISKINRYAHNNKFVLSFLIMHMCDSCKQAVFA